MMNLLIYIVSEKNIKFLMTIFLLTIINKIFYHKLLKKKNIIMLRFFKKKK